MIPDKSSDAQSSVASPQSNSGTKQGNRRGIVSWLRNSPRALWLMLSVSLLIIASVSWYLRARDWRYTPVNASPAPLTVAWWNQALVWNAAAGLPEIAGRLYWVGVEQRGPEPTRLWVAGAGGFAAGLTRWEDAVILIVVDARVYVSRSVRMMFFWPAVLG